MSKTIIMSENNPEELGEVREALVNKVVRNLNDLNRLETAVPDLLFSRSESPTEPTINMQVPRICVALQGTKRVILGEETYIYDAYNFLMNSAELPLTFQVIEASPEVPYIGVVLKLNLKTVSQMLLDTSLPLPKLQPDGRGIAVSKVSVRLLNTLHRLVDLLDTPEDIPVLAPLIQRELIYHLLVGDQGHRLRQMVMKGTNSHQIGTSIKWLKQNFTKPLRVDGLAEIAGMSTSAFHEHFRTLTAMSPLQYQKWMRLHESRRLMLAENMDAGTAAFNVGYESQSQFSREYGRMFGAPPLQDIKRLRQHTAGI